MLLRPPHRKKSFPDYLGILLVISRFLAPDHLAAASPSGETPMPRRARISPDYQDILVPPNIAPLNFYIQEPGRKFRARLSSHQGSPIDIQTRQPLIDIPLAAWRHLLAANRGQSLYCDLAVLNTNGVWVNFTTITNTIARDDIDGFLVYRLLNWQFSMYGFGTIGIHERNLSGFAERTLVQARDQQHSDSCCMNCHSFILNQPDTMALHIRSEKRGKPMLIARGNQVTTVNQPAGLLAWHPSGKMIITGVNKFSMLFHSIGRNRDVFDSAGDLNAYFIEDNRFEKLPKTATAEFWETWPAWSPDGQFLYFCRTPVSSTEHYEEVKYDLLRIPYHLANNSWGDVETVLSARETGLSIAQPRISPDGKWLLFCMFPYSSFPGTQPGSDLYLMDLTNRKYRRLDEVNSDRSESWHGWSHNSRWLVFSSKRLDGLLTKPFFSHLDEQGRASKPFLLPQRDPAYYDSLLKMYNLPELVTGPVPFSERALYDAIYRPQHLVKPKGATPPPISSNKEYSPASIPAQPHPGTLEH